MLRIWHIGRETHHSDSDFLNRRSIPVNFASWRDDCRAITRQKIASTILVVGTIACGVPRVPEDIITAIKVWQQVLQVGILFVTWSWVPPIGDCDLRDPHLPSIKLCSAINFATQSLPM